MSKIAFTPGPWILGESLEAFVYALLTGNDVNRMSLQVQGGYTESGKTTREELDANARLIAVAPEMYEILSKVFTSYDVAMPIEMSEQIGAILAKAKGESQ